MHTLPVQPRPRPARRREGEDRVKIRGLFADERCSQAVLDFISTTDVGRLAPEPAKEDAQSKASEWNLRERKEGEKERRWEAEELDAGAEERLLFSPAPSFMASAEEGWGGGRSPLSFSWGVTCLRDRPGGGQRGAATSRSPYEPPTTEPSARPSSQADLEKVLSRLGPVRAPPQYPQ